MTIIFLAAELSECRYQEFSASPDNEPVFPSNSFEKRRSAAHSTTQARNRRLQRRRRFGVRVASATAAALDCEKRNSRGRNGTRRRWNLVRDRDRRSH